MSGRVDYYMEKLYLINKQLGGIAKEESIANSGDAFESVKVLLNKTIHETRCLIEERNEKMSRNGKNAETMRMDIDIKDKITEIERLLGGMNEELRKSSKNKIPKKELDRKERMYNNLRTQLVQLKKFSQENLAEKVNILTEKEQTLTELKSGLLTGGTDRSKMRTKANDLELQAIEEFKENDKKMDSALDKINEGLDQWKVKAKQIGEKVDETTIRIEKVTKEVDYTTSEIVTSNAKLKKVLEHYRAPSKFCFDIVLVLILLGLIGVLVKLIS